MQRPCQKRVTGLVKLGNYLTEITLSRSQPSPSMMAIVSKFPRKFLNWVVFWTSLSSPSCG